jgi:hypothetical protein
VYGVSILQPSEQQTPAITYPTYSWNATTIAHELGHNLGSPHTFACTWPNGVLESPGAIDGSSMVEGGCMQPPPPTPGQSTIMSYAENYPLTNAFGTPLGGVYVQPGDLIRSIIANVDCANCSAQTCNLFVTINSITPATSPMATDGAVDITPFGGSGNYTYMWSNGAMTQDLANVAAGTYNVTVTDSQDANCMSMAQATVPVVIPKSRRELFVVVNGDILCTGDVKLGIPQHQSVLQNASCDMPLYAGDIVEMELFQNTPIPILANTIVTSLSVRYTRPLTI